MERWTSTVDNVVALVNRNHDHLQTLLQELRAAPETQTRATSFDQVRQLLAWHQAAEWVFVFEGTPFADEKRQDDQLVADKVTSLEGRDLTSAKDCKQRSDALADALKTVYVRDQDRVRAALHKVPAERLGQVHRALLMVPETALQQGAPTGAHDTFALMRQAAASDIDGVANQVS